MGFIHTSVPFEVSVGSVTITAPTASTSTVNGDKTQSNFVIPANAAQVYIKNISPQAGGAMVDATISIGGNTIPLPPGVDFNPNDFFNRSGNVDEKLPAINVTTNGADIYYYYINS